MQAFTQAAEAVETIMTEGELVEMAGYLFSATMGTGICLTSMLGKKQTFGFELRETIPRKLYIKALEIAGSHADSYIRLIPQAIAQDFSPQRIWPITLAHAFSIEQKLEIGGFVPDTDVMILDNDEDYPEALRPRRIEFAHEACETLSDFVTEGLDLIREHMGYKYKINPRLMPNVMHFAEINNVDFQKDALRDWFTPCLSNALDAEYPQPPRQFHII